MKELILKLSENELIEILTVDRINFNKIDFSYGEIQAYFVNNKEVPLCIGEETASSFFISFINNLKKAIDNELPLHESLTRNLGVLYNEYHQDQPGFFMVSSLDGLSRYWVGANYIVWSTYNTTKPMLTSWLYNDNEGNIIFEVTKNYKWSTCPDDPEDPDFMSYGDFMKDYKPLIHRTIPRDIAVKWLKDVMKIHKSLFISEENYQFFCKKFLSI